MTENSAKSIIARKRRCPKCQLSTECTCAPDDCQITFSCNKGKGHKGICDVTGFNWKIYAGQLIEEEYKRHPELRVFNNAVSSLLKENRSV